MTAWVEAPLAAADLETTSADPLTARIVTATLVTINGDQVDEQTWLLNPGIDIDDGAAAVHGITTARAQAEGQDYATGYRELRDALETAWAQDRLIAIYNGSFDLTIIDREGQRLGYPPLAVGAVVDPFVVDRHIDPYRKGKRTLTATCEHYGVRLDGAHTATGDCLAAARLAWKLRAHPELARLTVDELMIQQQDWHHQRQASFADYLIRIGKDPSDVSMDWPLRKDHAA